MNVTFDKSFLKSVNKLKDSKLKLKPQFLKWNSQKQFLILLIAKN